MKLEQLFEQALTESFNPHDEYYHVGPNFDKFDFVRFGGGENNHLLGHGMYFINSQYTAKGYAKYSEDPVMYTVKFNANPLAFYNNRVAATPEQQEAYNKIANALGAKTYRDLKYNHSAMKYGRGLPGAVFEAKGSKAGRELLIQAGVLGQIEEVDGGVFEVAVYDLSIIQIIKKEELPGMGKPKSEPDPELDAWWEEMMKGGQ